MAVQNGAGGAVSTSSFKKLTHILVPDFTRFFCREWFKDEASSQ